MFSRAAGWWYTTVYNRLHSSCGGRWSCLQVSIYYSTALLMYSHFLQNSRVCYGSILLVFFTRIVTCFYVFSFSIIILVCFCGSFSAFDFQKHGNRNYGSPYNASRIVRSSQGKMEKSFLRYVLSNVPCSFFCSGLVLFPRYHITRLYALLSVVTGWMK